ncbi:MAG: bifunctional hydroxymethylpyrimidine kinase/phosphomethylpyrimidine kinase [Prevotella sp.]|nr:bifunctional hydroxymethylpyrimidine kinase/phosphomethylpyrimidine kinase [Bacteroides sp.]MCM1365891.1 bifunctional hydroxymethylpyrimidine kinase/phosphomethylpyrimidine kinase [Prevotella sp.]
MSQRNYSTVLCIAGIDPSGGAGLLADVKVCQKLHTYAMGIVTAITAQNTFEVNASEAINPSMLRDQLETVLCDIIPDAVKIGMLPNADSVKITAETISKYNLHNVVVDPVLISSTGTPLVDDLKDGIEARKKYLFPLATLVTPNIPEAEILGLNNGNKEYAVLLKGGHSEHKNECSDILMIPGQENMVFTSKKLECKNTHGTGCVLSSSISALLARGLSLAQAVNASKDLITRYINRGKDISFGKGNGPVWLL